MFWTVLAFAIPLSILDIQRELSSIDGPRGYYTKTYSKQETTYWQQLPAWMEEDSRSHKVKRILDIGCGYGTLLAFAAKQYGAAAGFCMDTTEYLWPRTRAKYKLSWAKGNIELDVIPFPGQFDVIVMTEVLEHFNFQALPTLRKMRAALALGGVLFLSTPDVQEWGQVTKYYKSVEELPQPARGTKVVDDHVWVYSKEEIEKLLLSAGFKIAKFEYAPGVGHRHFNIMATRD